MAVTEPHPASPIPPFRLLGPGRFVSLRTKFVLFFSLIIIVTCSGMSWYFVQHKRVTMTERILELGTVLVKNLAHNVRYGIILEERVILDQFIDGVMSVDEVVYAKITGSDGQVLAEKSKGTLNGSADGARTATRPLYPQPELARHVLDAPPQQPTITHLRLDATGLTRIPTQQSSLRLASSDGSAETFYDFAVSVLTRPSSRLESLSLHEEEMRPNAQPPKPPQVFGVVQVGLTEVLMQRELVGVLRNFFLLTLGIISAGILCTNLLARRIITPLRHLAAGARQVGGGNLATFVTPTTQDEVGQLTALFNLMTQSLRQREQEAASNFATIQRQIAQLTTLNQASAAITSTLDLDRLLSTVLQLLCENLGFTRMVLFFWDDEQGLAFVAQVFGVSPEEDAAIRRLSFPVKDDGGVAAQLMLEGKAVLVEDVNAVVDRISPMVRPVLAAMGIFSFVCVPLRSSRQKILGYIGADRKTLPCNEDDLHLLMTVANHVAVAVDNARSYTQLAALKANLEQRVQDRTHDLQAANDRLQEHDRRRSKFVSVASHELRTPMTSIKGFVENMLDGLTGPLSDRQEHYLHRVKHNVDRLTRIINQLLDWSRLDVGRIDIKAEPLYLGDVLPDVIESFHPLADEKGLTLDVLPCEHPVVVHADRDKLEQILVNLVGNAIKFTPPSGRITVGCRTLDDRFVQITVSDTGCGIAPHEMPNVFNEFSKIESAMPTSQGAQLGLFITKSLVRLHGGQMTVESRLGVGTQFMFTLPLYRPPTQPS